MTNAAAVVRNAAGVAEGVLAAIFKSGALNKFRRNGPNCTAYGERGTTDRAPA